MSKKIVHISDQARQAKYRQIINSILESVQRGSLNRGDKLPSINDIAHEFSLSRDTVMLAFSELKARGVVAAMPGIGYYIESTNVNVDQKIFLLFDEFNAFKETLYNSFIHALPDTAQVDLYFHHFNHRVFQSLIRDHASRYTSFVILPGNLTSIGHILKELPADKVYLIDQLTPELGTSYPAVYQDFEDDIYQCLLSGLSLLLKYNHFVLAYPGGKEPIGFVDGFVRFCNDHQLSREVISSFDNRDVKPGEVYILPNDLDLVQVIKNAHRNRLRIGEDFGIISINDVPLKEVIAGGVTTISTDFKKMGESIAKMVTEFGRGRVRNPSSMIVRSTL
ncbi:MAG: GntR family transcriptional regulator [Marinilabiliaceae bacterium]|nr:GntR family transcriptional regulator [Marinilabiliaceae bacterium]